MVSFGEASPRCEIVVKLGKLPLKVFPSLTLADLTAEVAEPNLPLAKAATQFCNLVCPHCGDESNYCSIRF